MITPISHIKKLKWINGKMSWGVIFSDCADALLNIYIFYSIKKCLITIL